MRALHVWRVRRLLRGLDGARGSGTSLVTILIPPGGDRLAKTNRMLNDEVGAASCIKSRVNRSEISSLQKKY